MQCFYFKNTKSYAEFRFLVVYPEGKFLMPIFRRVVEFLECGDMDMMVQYLKDVQSVQKKVAELVETIDFINVVIYSIPHLLLYKLL